MSGVVAGELAAILERKRSQAADLRCGAAALWAAAESMAPVRPFVAALSGGAVIAEMKRRSPSGGSLRPDLRPAAMARAYTEGGAAALSVLTDADGFGGSLADLAQARQATPLPVLRKDFTVDPVQIAEARVAGADAVLLIVAALDADGLDACLEAARRASLDVLVEAHDEVEVRRAAGAGAACVGINNRDLRTLRTDLGTFARLRRLVPDGVACVAESGVRGPADVRRLVGAGADAVLVGEALLRAPDAVTACTALVEAGRSAAEGVASGLIDAGSGRG